MDNQMMNLVISMGLLLLLGLFSAAAFGAMSKRKRESKAPRLGAEVHVVSKRMEASHREKKYFVTFRLKNDETLELEVPEETYGQLQEEDFVKIVFKGETFEEFHRLEGHLDTAETEKDTSASTEAE